MDDVMEVDEEKEKQQWSLLMAILIFVIGSAVNGIAVTIMCLTYPPGKSAMPESTFLTVFMTLIVIETLAMLPSLVMAFGSSESSEA